MKKITMKDIANELEVSSMTVSKALRGSEDISLEMRKLVEETAIRLGYIYKMQKETSVAVIISSRFLDENDGFYGNLYSELNTVARAENIVLSLLVLDVEDEVNLKLIKDLNEYNGVIILGQVSKEYTEEVQKQQEIIITVDFQHSDLKIDSIASNNFMGSYYATSHLIKNGHNDILFVGNIKSTSSIRDRYLGYLRALLESGIDAKEKHYIIDRDDDNKQIEIKLPEKMPTAFVCNNDYIARKLINKINDIGLKVPDDVSIVGFDNTIYSELSKPRITTIKVPRDTMAKLTIELLLRRMKIKSSTVKNLHVELYLVEKESVKKI